MLLALESRSMSAGSLESLADAAPSEASFPCAGAFEGAAAGASSLPPVVGVLLSVVGGGLFSAGCL